MTRLKLLEHLADVVCAVTRSHPVRVAIDGVDAAGKTILAEALAPLIEERGRPVIRASVDGFHNPQAVRYQKGVDSPEGYYRDSFNYAALLQDLLIPLGPGGNREYRPAVFNLAEDAPTHEPLCTAPANAILLFDGVFLLRPELIEQWDFSIFIEVDFSVAVPRAVLRDVTRNQRQWDTNTRRAQYERRYVPGQQMYLHAVHPRKRADVVVDNNDFRDPKIIRK